MQVQAYLSFNGRCEEALAFYQEALGAQVLAMIRFNEAPDPPPAGMVPPGAERKIMHSAFMIGDSTVMATDGDCSGKTEFMGVSLTLQVADAAEAGRVFKALADGGQVRMALDKTFWSPCFGMLVDRFGVSWMVNVVV